MEELLRLEMDHQQLQQEKMQQRLQQQQLLQLQRAKAAAGSMSTTSSSITSPTTTNNNNNNNNYDNNNDNNPTNNPSNSYDNIYNTTNSLIGDNIAKRPSPHQLINPPSSPAKQLCAEQVLLSAASLLQNQIYRSVISTSKNKIPSADPMSVSTDTSSLSGQANQGSQTSRKAFSEFNAIPSLPTDCGGPCHPSQISSAVLEREMRADESMYDEILTGQVPTIDTIHRSVLQPSYLYTHILSSTLNTYILLHQYINNHFNLPLAIHTFSNYLVNHRFMCYLNHRAGFSTECNVIALMYVNRITLLKSAVPVTTHSWRALWAISVVIGRYSFPSPTLSSPPTFSNSPSFSSLLSPHSFFLFCAYHCIDSQSIIQSLLLSQHKNFGNPFPCVPLPLPASYRPCRKNYCDLWNSSYWIIWGLIRPWNQKCMNSIVKN